MSTAIENTTTTRRRPEDAATIGVMLLKASISGLSDGLAPAESSPRKPVLIDGAAVSAFALA